MDENDVRKAFVDAITEAYDWLIDAGDEPNKKVYWIIGMHDLVLMLLSEMEEKNDSK